MCLPSLPVHAAKPVNPGRTVRKEKADSFERCREADDNERAPLSTKKEQRQLFFKSWLRKEHETWRRDSLLGRPK